MAEFKKLSDVEVVAEPAESANVLIEEDGVIKKAPKTAVGGNGDVSWNDLTDKPFYEEVTTTILIPETEGVVITFDHYIEYDSSVIPSWNEGDILTIKWDGVEYEAVCEYNSEIDENAYFFNVNGMWVMFRQYDCIDSMGSQVLVEGDIHTYSVYKKESTIKKIDKKFISETEWDAVITGSADTENGETNYTLTFGTYESLVQKLNNGETPKIKLDGEWYFGSGMAAKMFGYSTAIMYSDIIGQINVFTPCFDTTLYIYSDNSVGSS